MAADLHAGAAGPTPGPDLAAPWSVVAATAHHGVYIEDCAGRTVCDLYALDARSKPRGHHDAEVRGPLLASAPDLLAALQGAEAAMAEVLSHRVPGATRGDLRDNDASRRALAELDKALSTARTALLASRPTPTDGGRA